MTYFFNMDKEKIFYSPVIQPAPVYLKLPVDAIDWRGGLLVRGVNWLGDTLMILPALQQLRMLLPRQSNLYVMCPKALAPVYEAAEFITGVISLTGKRADLSARRRIRQINFGAALLFPNSFGSALDVFMQRIPIRIGRSGRGRSFFLTHRLPEWKRNRRQSDRHQLSHYLELVSVFGEIHTDLADHSLKIQDSESSAVKYGIKKRGPGLLALAPGAAYGPAKQWPASSFQKVLAQWIDMGGSAVLVGTQNEYAAAAAIAEGLPHTVNVAGKTSLRDLMAILEYADFTVVNDSGAMHLAAALGTPGVAMFGATDPVATGPLGAPYVILKNDEVPCAPCFRRTCQRNKDPYACLNRITPEQVMTGLTQLKKLHS